MQRKPPVSPESALASDVFDLFCSATTLKSILNHHRHLCEILRIKPTNFPHFYPKFKSKLGNWKAQALWNKFDKRASHKCYNRGKACSQTKVLIIGAGPCGLRTAIDAQLLGARVVVVEKRDRITRNNVLHLWPFVIQDLRGLGAKKFFGRFCAGSIDHISIRQLQCILLKVALIIGVEIHEGVGFESLIPPPESQDSEKIGWRAQVSPPESPVSQYEFDVLIGADGKRNTLDGFKRKEFRGKLAIAITANFLNKRTEAEARVEEISGVAFIFNQKFFKDLYAATGIDLENIVYYKDDTHYFVMTAKKHSLINKGVILHDYTDTAKLLDPENVDKEALLQYAKEAADFSTNYMMPDLMFAVNHYGQPDVAMFDFTSMYAAENASRVIEKNGFKLLQMLVGDSLLEPFWPTGSGCARGFLSSMDACWAIKNWSANGALSPLDVVAERESIYRILGQTTPENLHRDLPSYTLDPHTRYPNLNTRAVLPIQVRSLFETDDPLSMELALTPSTNASTQEIPKKRRRKDSQVHPETLLQWLKRQVCLHTDLHVENMTYSFKSGLVLCAIVSRYRPDLLDYGTLDVDNVADNNQKVFDILEREFGIPSVMTGQEMSECACPDRLSMLAYLSQVYDTFHGEIPHMRHPKNDYDETEEMEQQQQQLAMRMSTQSRTPRHSTSTRKRHSGNQRTATGGGVGGASQERTGGVGRIDSGQRKGRKRRSAGGADKLNFGGEERQQRLQEIEENRKERQLRRQYMRRLQTEQFKKSLAMMNCNNSRSCLSGDEQDSQFEDYSIYLYRQTAPEFQERVKELEMKLLYPDRESRLRAELKERAQNEPDEDFSGRIKEIEEKLLKGSLPVQKKPRDLVRAIGKIEKTDWNVKEIEKKIEENRFGKGVSHERPEKVPKWSREQFDDKFHAMEKKLINKGYDQETATRYAEVDVTLKRLEQKLKEGSCLDTGMRGSNKVSAMAEQFTNKHEENVPLQKSSSKGAIAVPTQGGVSEVCHFCSKRVYLMERVSAEGKFFHRGCFKCEYCGSTLRQGNYLYDKDGKYENRFYCNQHFGMPGTIKSRISKNQEKENKVPSVRATKNKSPDKPRTSLITNKHLKTPPTIDSLDRGGTPERIEFENLEDVPSEMDEDEWTDRNFGASAAEMGSSDDLLDMSDSEDDSDDDIDEDDACDDALMTADEARQVAERWSRRHSGGLRDIDTNGQDSCEADNSDDFDDCSEGEESGTATEGEEEMKALELRKQEVRLQPQQHRHDTDTGSDTEVASDDACTTESGSSEEIGNSATEISTDSEFEHDGTVATRREIPDILIMDHNCRKNKLTDELRRVQVKSGMIVKNSSVGKNEEKGVKLVFSPLVPDSKPTPIVNTRRGDYLLSKTQSTEGIATKMSLELRKKYLLGAPANVNNISKSGSATALDSRFKNFASNISECQKLLNPASEISPTMQAFLQSSPQVRPPVSPTAILTPPLNLPPSSMVLRRQKELPAVENQFQHVCGKKTGEDAVDEQVESLNVENVNGNQVKETSDHVSAEVEDKNNENTECRPRSPIHETSIVVPEITWDSKKNHVDSDSLSESDSDSQSSDTTTDEDKGNQQEEVKPPRLEITNSKGELMTEEEDVGLYEMDSLQPVDLHSPQSMAKQIELARTKIIELKNSILIGENELKKVSANCNAEEDRSVTSSPDHAQLTETELSDWARDGDNCVSEGLDDVEQKINEENKKKKKGGKKPVKVLGKNESLEHVCGKDKSNLQLPLHKLLASCENLDFMDTEVSDLDSVSATNETLLKNRGYIQFVNEDDLATPVVECQATPHVEDTPSSSSSSPQKSSSTCSTKSLSEVKPKREETTEESTTSEQTTIKDSPLVRNKNFDINDESFFTPLVDMSPISPTKCQDYEEYVRTIQGKLSPFQNVRDSIDYRRTKQPEVREENLTSEETTARKLQQLSRERSFQKDLVHEMVMNKVLASKKSPGERKAKRITRGKLVTSQPATPEATPEFHTPMTSVKTLPDTPLTNPAAFSIRDDFKTPIAPPREKNMSEQMRQEARARCRLKSDEELGLSPEDHIRQLREKANKILETPGLAGGVKRFETRLKSIDSGFKFSAGSKKTSPGAVLSKSSSTSKVFDKLRNSEKIGLGVKSGLKSTSDLVGACEKSPVSSGPSTSNSSHTKTTSSSSTSHPSKSRDRDRRKSLIQAVSDFFHKKSPSPTKQIIKDKDKFTSKFRLTPKNKTPENKETAVEAPPVPPPPAAYKHLSRASEESGGSEGEDGLLSAPTHGSSTSADCSSKRSRMTRRMARQAQLKRLRMAQGIQRRLEEVEEKQRELEVRGVTLERALRGEDSSSVGECDLLREWFEMMRERSELRRYEKELLMNAQEMELEDRHARLQQELRDRLAKDDSSKSAEEVAKEGQILREMLETVEKRDALTSLREQERQRFQEEDKDLEAQMLAKGLRLTPIRKYEYQSSI